MRRVTPEGPAICEGIAATAEPTGGQEACIRIAEGSVVGTTKPVGGGGR